MKGKLFKDFIDELYNNLEIEFHYNHERYILTGYIDAEGQTYTLDLWNISRNVSVFKYSDVIRKNCIERFEEAQIFSGKTIYEVANEITVEYE